jgi:MFS family permease
MGHALGNTLLGVRATLEGFPSWVMGLMTSGYFFGFLVGTQFAAKWLQRVGQIRVFAAFASIASTSSLLHIMVIDEVSWILLRFVYGICLATLFTVIEGWLNALATRENRGQVLSFYMILNFLAYSSSQLLLFTAQVESFELFAGVSILISIALVPLTMSQTQQPEFGQAERFGFRRLFQISPLATLGCFCNGLTMGAFWGLSSVYFAGIGLETNDIAKALSLSFLGGLLFQWPIGYCSDLIDRRLTISGTLFASTLVCLSFVFFVDDGTTQITKLLTLLAFLFGGCCYTLYSLYIALANDYLEPQQAIKASAGLLGFHAIGAIIGPTLASIMMTILGNKGLFAFIGSVNLLLCMFSISRVFTGRVIPETTHESFLSLPKTTSAILDLDPRTHEQD